MNEKRKKNKIFRIFLFFAIINIFKSSELSEVGEHLIFNMQESQIDLRGLSDNDYMEKKMFKKLYSKFNIGIPSQKLTFYYDINYFETLFDKNEYSQEFSSTYKKIENGLNNENKYLSQDIFEIKEDQKIENFLFFLKNNKTNEKNSNLNIIGLNFNVDNKNDSFSFLSQLKKNNYIQRKVFSFLFGDYLIREKTGFICQILIGCLPHDISSMYEEKDLKWISAKDNKISKNWHINFDTVKYNDDELQDKTAYLDFNLNFIIAPESFRIKLQNDFFKKNLEMNNCKENFFYSVNDEQFYIFYTCNTEAEFISIPTLNFYNKALNETFKISFEELFMKYKNIFYFNIIFNKKPQNNWILGNLLFKTYRFVFDLEEEKIGYYKTFPSKENPMMAVYCLLIALIIFGICFFFFGVENKRNKELEMMRLQNQKMPEYTSIQNEKNNINQTNINKEGNNNNSRMKEKQN